MDTKRSLSLTLAAFALACAPEQRATVMLPVSAQGGDGGTFVLGDEVELVLEEAWITFGDLRLEEPHEVSWRSRLAPIGSAWAHPGHDFSGDTVGELLGGWTLDLLGEPLELGEATCLEGSFATARFAIAGSPAAFFAGVATLADGSGLDFELELELDDEITGVPIGLELDAQAPPAGLALQAFPSTMLSFIQWSTPDEDGDPTLTTAEGTVLEELRFGVMSTASYGLEIID